MGFGVYTLEQYEKAIELKKQGLGSLRISKILGLKRRGAIEDWINKGRKPYYYSESRIEAINSKENIERMRRMNAITQPKATKIAAKLKTKRLPERAKILGEDLAYILGVAYGDGHVSVKQRRVILSVTDYDFADVFRKTLEKWSGFNTRFYSRNLKKPDYIKNRKLQWVAHVDSIEVAKFLSKFNLDRIKNESTKIKSSFLNGMFDSEGGVSKDGCLSFYNKDQHIISLVKNLLDSLRIKNNIRSYYGYTPDKSKKFLQYKITILKESNQRFKKLIGFNIERKQRRLMQSYSQA